MNCKKCQGLLIYQKGSDFNQFKCLNCGKQTYDEIVLSSNSHDRFFRNCSKVKNVCNLCGEEFERITNKRYCSSVCYRRTNDERREVPMKRRTKYYYRKKDI